MNPRVAARVRLLTGLLALALVPAQVPPNSGAAPLAVTDGSLAEAPRLLGTVRFMALNPDGSPRSRYCYRQEMDAMGDSLLNRLRGALGPAAGRADFAAWDFHSEPVQWDPTHTIPARTTLRNLVATLHGAQPGGLQGAGGTVLVTAHYDAIAKQTSGWQGWDQPAPGGDDNGSGVAAVLEIARLAALDPTYPFDVQFVLFDGEELGLLGSLAYADSLRRDNARVLAVLNMDMIGYNPRADSLVVMTNRSSSLLADYLIDTERATPQPGLELVKTVNNLIAFSDHRPFWDNDYPAILLIENVKIDKHNPNYHRLSDQVDYLSRQGEMMAKAANICLRALRRLADTASTPPHLVVGDDALQLYVNGVAEGRLPVPGDSLVIRAAVMNTGGPLAAGQSRTVRFHRAENGIPVLMGDAPLEGPMATGARRSAAWAFRATAADAGALNVEVTVSDDSFASTARRSFAIRGDGLRVLHHYVAPNPVADQSRGAIVYEMTTKANVRVTVYDMVGSALGRLDVFDDGSPDGVGVPGGSIGQNRVLIRDVVEGRRLTPGVYLYHIETFSLGAATGTLAQGKFVLLR